jgi:hypothetical protein
VQRRSPSAVYLPRHLSFQSRDQWHPSQLVCQTRSSRCCAQRLLLPSSNPETRHRMCLGPRSLRLLSPRPVERHYHLTLGDYIRKSSRCGGRMSNSAQRDWLFRHRRAIRRGMRSLLVLSSLDTNLWGLYDCYVTHALHFVGTQDISIIHLL